MTDQRLSNTGLPPGSSPANEQEHDSRQLMPQHLDSLLDRAEASAAPDALATVTESPAAGPLGQITRFIARSGKRIAVAIVGGAVLLAGVAMLVLPGPAIVVIPAGLAILATEFAWARTALDRAKAKADQAKQLAMGGDRNRNRFLAAAALCCVFVAGAVAWSVIR
jgi:uncharacterized protein (TIGR02611 family)